MPAAIKKSEIKSDIINAVIQAGIIGAGGAGFPTHAKLMGEAELVVANGAECEPLLESDRHLMLREPGKVISGIKAVVKAVGAQKGIIAIKRKHEDIIRTFMTLLAGERKIELFLLDNFYPAGDEHVLVYEVTGRLVPAGGIPLNCGVVVNNVYTLAMIADALGGKNFTHRYVTVTGAVRRPAVAELPIGMSIREAVEKVGGGLPATDYRVIIGGPMMGKVENDLDKPILKTTGGLIVLPGNSKLVNMKTASIQVTLKRGRSVCCQCSHCTGMCPRHLLGHGLKPHEIMRAVSASQESLGDSAYKAALCSECGLCGFYACTMGLAPNQVNGFLKGVLAGNGIKPDFKGAVSDGASSFRSGRKVPTQRLTGRLGLEGYDGHLPFIDETIKTEQLDIRLKQHIGAASVPVVRQGDTVRAGDLVARMPEKALGANIHCPFDGTVKQVYDDRILIACQ